MEKDGCASDLEKFLIALSEDSNLRNEYQENPKAAMEKAGLTHDEQVMVLRGDTKGIQEAIGKDVESLITIIIHINNK